MQAHGGEVSSGPLLTLGDLSAMDAVAEVDQADADRVKEGDAATVTILGTTVPGKVTRVGRLVGRNQLHERRPADVAGPPGPEGHDPARRGGAGGPVRQHAGGSGDHAGRVAGPVSAHGPKHGEGWVG